MSVRILSLPKVFYDTRVIIWTLAFAFPLILNQNQIITGTFINALLFISVSRLTAKEFLALSVLPSLGALTHGALFGPFTFFIFYFLPAIWLGNFFIFKIKQPILAILSKVAVLFVMAYLLVSLHAVPPIFLTAMGVLQLLTATSGFVLAKIYDRRRAI